MLEEMELCVKMCEMLEDVMFGFMCFVVEIKLLTDKGFYRVRAYRYANSTTGDVIELVCVIYGDVEGCENVLVCVYDVCFMLEVLGLMKCDCK